MTILLKTIIILSAFLFAGSASAQNGHLPEGRPGIAVDSRGGSVVDPTKNVLDLVEAGNKRQDDLRNLQAELHRQQDKAAEQLNELRYKHAQELANALVTKLEDEAKLRAEYSAILAIAEAKRIDAIRAVDVNAVAVANQRTSEQATALQTQTTASAEVLRNQVARSAEDLRALVATTAATALQNQQQQFLSISNRLTTLEQAGSEFKGKQTFQDPELRALITKVDTIGQSLTTRTGQDTGRSDVYGWIFGAIMMVIMLAGLALNYVRRSNNGVPRGG